MSGLTLGKVVSLGTTDATPRDAGPSPTPGAIEESRGADGGHAVAHPLAELRAQIQAELELTHAERTLALATLQARIVEQARGEVVQLARLLAERILTRELLIRPESIAQLADEVLRGARGAHQVTLHASPTDAAYLSERLAALQLQLGGPVTVRPDSLLNPGDLRLETDIGCIDARIGTQLTHLATSLFEPPEL
jgi:flagellar biosynthesis/type III secretory pathway protein FliH